VGGPPGAHDGPMSDAMAADQSEADLREHLRRIDDEINELRRELDELREDTREWEDWEDGATLVRLREEHEAVLQTLERHRLELLERLGKE
jgi:prefoldin subunit 5